MSWLRNSISLASTTAMLGLIASSCAENESMLYVMGVLSVEETDCVATPESSAALRPAGTLDLSLTGRYSAALLVGSQLTQRGSRERLRTETARFSLEGAEVTLEDRNGPVAGVNPNPFTSRGTGLVNAASGTEPGVAAMFVDLVPASISGALPEGSITAKIRVFGKTLGGSEIETGEFRFPISICRGCLVSFVGGTGACAAMEGGESNVCRLGQDQPAPCSLCASVNAACADPCSNCSAWQQSSLCSQKPPNCP